MLDNYRPISRLSATTKVFESMVKYYLSANNILCQTQLDFRQDSTITAAMAATNDIITALDVKKSCAASLLIYRKHLIL